MGPYRLDTSKLRPINAELVEKFSAELVEQIAKVESTANRGNDWTTLDLDRLKGSMRWHAENGKPLEAAIFAIVVWARESFVAENFTRHD